MTVKGQIVARLVQRCGDWIDHAACARTTPAEFHADSEAAKKVCAGCPVQAECLAFATANRMPVGVWGGVDFGAPQRGRSSNECGTPAGFRRHRREKTAVCPECRSAYNASERDRQASKKVAS